ncbi:MAG: hypothetical protein CMI36_15350 [Owenweeksia sp.]|nr:hypothetical protein [Owenweeksia sp.]
MIAVLTGDIIDSRKLPSQDIWLQPLKSLLGQCGTSPQQWDIYRGDSFQLALEDPAEALKAAIRIKALIKSLSPEKEQERISEIDVRLAIGIGEKNYEGAGIAESNGPVFIQSGERLEKLKKEKITLAIQTPWEDLNREMNLFLRLASILMDSWTISSGEIVNLVFEKPDQTQSKIGQQLGIKQNTVSDRLRRAHIEDILELDQLFREKLQKHLK